MATGTRKTRTYIGLCYRLLKAKRFRRILFLVDRSALGEQSENAFKDARLESLQTFDAIFDLKGMDTVQPEKDGDEVEGAEDLRDVSCAASALSSAVLTVSSMVEALRP
jgi:type I site-specific restriction endonuclease